MAERYEQTRSAIERTNCQMVLLADEGRTITEIAWLVRRGREQVRRILHRFRSEGLGGLAPGRHTGRPLGVTPAWQAELQPVIDLDPHTVGVESAVWTTRLLAVKGSRLVRALLEEVRGQLVLVYTPPYDPEANRIEWLWRALRRAVTHMHTRQTLPPLLEGADAWAHTISPTEILRQIGSPFADADPVHEHELTRAA